MTFYLFDRYLRPLRKSHVGQPPSAVQTVFRRRRGCLRYILMREDNDRDFRKGLYLVLSPRKNPMARQANRMLIGLFVIIALIIFVISLAVLGSGKFFKRLLP